VIAGSLHALLDKLEDQAPEATMEQAIREVEAIADDVRSELGKATANRHLAQQQHAELNKRHLQLSENIETAIVEKREDLARVAVSRQLDIEAQLPVLETTLADLVREENELKGYVDALLGKRREMQEALNNYRTSRARAEAAVANVSASSASGRLENATGAFDNVYQRQTGLNVVGHAASLEQAGRLRELEELSRNNKIDERLAKLKAARPG
jgi:phage shock protein A